MQANQAKQAKGGGETIFTQEINSLPLLRVPPIITAIAPKMDVPSAQAITSAILKLLRLRKLNTV